MTLKHAEKEGQISLLWPLAKHSELLPKVDAKRRRHAAAKAEDPWDDLSKLPGHARSFLKVLVPVSVNLASQKHTIQEIRELVPGASSSSTNRATSS